MITFDNGKVGSEKLMVNTEQTEADQHDQTLPIPEDGPNKMNPPENIISQQYNLPYSKSPASE